MGTSALWNTAAPGPPPYRVPGANSGCGAHRSLPGTPHAGLAGAQPLAHRLMSASTDSTLRVAGRFELQPHERRLLVDGNPASLGARAFDLLRHFAERPGRLVSRQELMDVVWRDLVVTDNNIQQQVSALRKLLGANAIETVPGLGYRFVANVDAPPATVWPAGEAAALPSATATLKTNLPGAPTPLIGREHDLAALAALVDEHRLVTVIGAGGIGKSRLAQALLFAQRETHRHGVCLVDLSITAEPGAVPGVVGAALGVSTGSGADATQGLVDALAPLAVLIALDNAEHLLAAVAAVAEALHRGAPHVRLLVTSQVPLRIIGEQLYRLGPLDVPADTPCAAEAHNYGALALFSERARAADRRFRVTDDNIATVVEVCRRLDGVALPIELAAARVPLLGLPKLAASLDQRLRLLTAGSLTAPPRQQTLRAALEWSHALLGEAERKVFRRLAVFVGSASLEAAQQVAADDAPGGTLDAWAVLDALGALVDRSLVAVVGSERRPRYRLLDTPRSFALERLRASGEEDAARRRHALALRARFEPALDERYAGRIGIDDWCAALEPDCDNAVAAARWAAAHGDAASALAIAPALHSVMSGAPQQRECSALWEAVEPLLDTPDNEAQWPILYGRAASACAHFHVVKRPMHAQARALQAVRALQASSDRIGLYVAYDRLCWPSARIGQTAQREAAVEAMRALEDPAWAPAVKLYRAECEHFLLLSHGDFDGAMRWAHRQIEFERAAGWSQSIGRSNAILAAVTAGRAGEVLDNARAAVAHFEAGRDYRTLAFARYDLTAALLATGAAAEARDVAWRGWRETGTFGMQAWWADQLALLAALESRPHAAARLAGYADAQYAATGERRDAQRGACVERAMTLAADALGGAAMWQELKTEGATLSDADVVALAFGDARSH
jgi:predicted ATPase/DNA-binding winged helix-turn-helix (wHTH) protein